MENTIKEEDIGRIAKELSEDKESLYPTLYMNGCEFKVYYPKTSGVAFVYDEKFAYHFLDKGKGYKYIGKDPKASERRIISFL